MLQLYTKLTLFSLQLYDHSKEFYSTIVPKIESLKPACCPILVETIESLKGHGRINTSLTGCYYNHRTGLLDLNTGLDWCTHIFLVYTHSVAMFVMPFCLQVAFYSLNVRTVGRYNNIWIIFHHNAEWTLVIIVRHLLVLLHWFVACSIQFAVVSQSKKLYCSTVV